MSKMNRKDIIEKLKSHAPIITAVTATQDMGYEFSAIVPSGVIYGEPGMLLTYSEGKWPPVRWMSKTEKEYDELEQKFLLDDIWEVKPWEELSDGEIKQWLDVVISIKSLHESLEILYSINNGRYKISFSTYLKRVDNDAISACEWDHLDERALAMKPIIGNDWDVVEQILGYAVNDNFLGDLPFEETRYFTVNNEGLLEYSSDVAEIEAKIIIRKC